jgi:hypothetical protein
MLKKIAIIVLTVAAIVAIVWLVDLKKANKILEEERVALAISTTESAQAAPTVESTQQPTQQPTGNTSTALTTEEVKELSGLSGIARNGTEAAAWYVGGLEVAMEAVCPSGFLCTFAETDGVYVYIGEPGMKKTVYGGTWRHIEEYPLDDEIQKGACALLEKEKAFGASETPSFTVTSGNFICP